MGYQRRVHGVSTQSTWDSSLESQVELTDEDIFIFNTDCHLGVAIL